VMVCGVVNVNLTLAYFIFLQSDENFTWKIFVSEFRGKCVVNNVRLAD
jgi:heme/copper-type cytochrome/quinol oxidase subunit 4